MTYFHLFLKRVRVRFNNPQPTNSVTAIETVSYAIYELVI